MENVHLAAFPVRREIIVDKQVPGELPKINVEFQMLGDLHRVPCQFFGKSLFRIPLALIGVVETLLGGVRQTDMISVERPCLAVFLNKTGYFRDFGNIFIFR